jgi:type IV fimbrial biogenesis protein FimT
MHRERGFTLVELMTILAVVAVLLTVATPALQQFTNNSRQTGGINDFISSMHIARNTAITTNARVTLCASKGGANCEAVAWNQGWIVFTDQNSNRVVDAGEKIVGTAAGINGLDIVSGEFPSFLVYRPTGRAMTVSVTGNSGQFTICDKRGAGYAKAVIMDLSGRPRMSEYSITGTPLTCI